MSGYEKLFGAMCALDKILKDCWVGRGYDKRSLEALQSIPEPDAGDTDLVRYILLSSRREVSSANSMRYESMSTEGGAWNKAWEVRLELDRASRFVRDVEGRL